jgi:hypothetical protein
MPLVYHYNIILPSNNKLLRIMKCTNEKYPLRNITSIFNIDSIGRYAAVSKSFRTGRLEQELQVVQLSVTRCSCIAILCVSLVSFASITLCVAAQQVFIVIVDFVIDTVRKLLDIPS